MQHENSQLLGHFTQIRAINLTTNLIKITHLPSLSKSPHQLKKEFPS